MPPHGADFAHITLLLGHDSQACGNGEEEEEDSEHGSLVKWSVNFLQLLPFCMGFKFKDFFWSRLVCYRAKCWVLTLVHHLFSVFLFFSDL